MTERAKAGIGARVAGMALAGVAAIGLLAAGAGTALAFGPDGELEVWGKGEVTVALGRSLLSGTEDSDT